MSHHGGYGFDLRNKKGKRLQFCVFTNITIRNAISKKRESHLATKNAGRLLSGLKRSDNFYET